MPIFATNPVQKVAKSAVGLSRLPAGVLTAFLFMLTALNCGASADLNAKYFFQSGNELRILVETSVKTSPFWSHSTTTSNSKGWLVCVDLASDKPIRRRTRVYGPLWDTPNAHTGFDGIVFTKEDQEAAKVTPFVAFDFEGNIVRIQHSAKEGPQKRSLLQIGPDSAVWQPQEPYSPPPEKIEHLSEDALQTLSHRYQLRRDKNGNTTLYETLSGQPVAKPWLTKAFATYRAMTDMGNVSAWVTEDLGYLICFPASIWNRGNQSPLVTEFEWAGKAYPRKEYAFLFREPEADPIIFRRPTLEGSIGLLGMPAYAFLIDGRPYLEDKTQTKVVLWPILGEGPRYELATAQLPGWPAEFFRDNLQHVAKDSKLIFFVDDFMAGRHEPSENIITFTWNYRTNAVERHETNVRELFRNFLGEYSPHTAIKPVEK